MRCFRAMSTTVRLAVIGAGAAGLAGAKAALDAGLDVDGYDLGERPGGLWVLGNGDGISPAYESLHLNTSRRRTEYADFPMPASWPDYPSVERMAGYLADYAKAFGVAERFRFRSEVTRVEREGGNWLVEVDGQEAGRYDAVLVANGHNWDPRWPDPPYSGEFAGEQMHAHDYRSAETFRDRRVLVVGMGNSAMDIAVDASHVARSVLLSARRGVHIVPKYLFGRPADATGGALSALPWRLRQALAETLLRLAVGRPESYGLPAPADGLFQDHPTISDTILHRLTHGEVLPRPGVERLDRDSVVFTDGTAGPVDLIVWATGYRVTIPFLSERWMGPEPDALPLYQRVFHLDDPSLAFVGLMQSTGSALPIVEAQAKLAAAHFGGIYSLPSASEQARSVHRAHVGAVKRWGEHKRPMMRVDFDNFLSLLRKELTAGSERRRRGGPAFAASPDDTAVAA